jgi:hypothetical protein
VNRANLSTIFAETSRKETYLAVAYRTITKPLEDAQALLLVQGLKLGFKAEGKGFEAGVLEGLRHLVDNMLKDVEVALKEQKKELWSRVEKENGIIVGPDEEMGRWGLKIPYEQLDKAMNKLEADKGTYGDVVAQFEDAEAQFRVVKALSVVRHS